MSAEMKKNLTISQKSVKDIESRINELSAKGIVAKNNSFVEFNVGGCKSSSCMAWA